MAWLTREIGQLGCRVFDTNTNFFLVEVGRDGRAFYEAMLRQGVIVRPVGNYGLPNHLRITIGTREQNERMLAALEKALHP